jgi:hypothetical protein
MRPTLFAKSRFPRVITPVCDCRARMMASRHPYGVCGYCISHAVIDKLFSVFIMSSDFCKPRNGSDVVRTYKSVFQAYPDIRDDIETVVIARIRQPIVSCRRKDKGSSAFRFELMTFFRFSGGRIVEDDTFFDTYRRRCEA